MAARGSEAKEKIIQNILTTFPGAFKYDKEIRIPMVENGETIQIKVTLTAAKTNVAVGADEAMPGTPTKEVVLATPNNPIIATKDPIEPTEEEKQNLQNYLNMLGLSD